MKKWLVAAIVMSLVVTLSGGCGGDESTNGDSTALAAPTSLVATAGDTEVTLNWADNTETDLAGYNVYRSEVSGGPYTKAATVTVSGYTDTGLTNGTTYYYAVTAFDDSDNESGYSAEVSATPATAEEGTGTLKLNLSDAPIDADDVEGVYIKINEIQYHLDGENGEWITFEDFEGPQTHNLLELTGGNFALLGNLTSPAGRYTQIRFMLEIQEQGPNPPTNPGCYVKFTDDTTQPLFVPSGGQSGYKAVGAFEVPVNGEVEVTADFDVRKAVHVTGQGQNQRYILKPTIRLIVNDEAGRIGGSVTNLSGYTNIVVFAYEDDAWDESEADDPTGEESRFPTAVTSGKMDEESNYILALLAAGTYDLVVAGFDGDTFGDVLGFISDVEVESEETTTQDIDTSLLESEL